MKKSLVILFLILIYMATFGVAYVEPKSETNNNSSVIERKSDIYDKVALKFMTTNFKDEIKGSKSLVIADLDNDGTDELLGFFKSDNCKAEENDENCFPYYILYNFRIFDYNGNKINEVTTNFTNGYNGDLFINLTKNNYIVYDSLNDIGTIQEIFKYNNGRIFLVARLGNTLYYKKFPELFTTTAIVNNAEGAGGPATYWIDYMKEKKDLTQAKYNMQCITDQSCLLKRKDIDQKEYVNLYKKYGIDVAKKLLIKTRNEHEIMIDQSNDYLLINDKKVARIKYEITVFLKNKAIKLNSPIILEKEKHFFPMKEVVEILGASVSIDKENKIAKVKRGDTEIIYEVGKNIYTVNGVSKDMGKNISPFIENGIFYVPIKEIVTVFGYTLEWNDKTKAFKVQ